MRSIKWYVAIAATCFWATAYGQEDAPIYRDMPLHSKGELRVFAETASFRGPQNLTRLEVYTLIGCATIAVCTRRRQIHFTN